MSNRSTLLLEHHLKELKGTEAAHLPAGVPQAGRPVRRRGSGPSRLPAQAGRTGTH